MQLERKSLSASLYGFCQRIDIVSHNLSITTLRHRKFSLREEVKFENEDGSREGVGTKKFSTWGFAVRKWRRQMLNLAWPWLVKDIGIIHCTLAPILKSPLFTVLMAKSYPNIPSHPGCQKSREKHRFMILNFWWDLQTNALFFLRGFLILKFSICHL